MKTVHLRSRNNPAWTVCGKISADVIRDREKILSTEKLCVRCAKQKTLQLKIEL